MFTHRKPGRPESLIRLVPVAFGIGFFSVGYAGESADQIDTPDYRIPLTHDDLRMITLAVLKTHPLISSSPGVKFAEGYPSYQIAAGNDDPSIASIDTAHVIFRPHAESAGIKEAFQVVCSREHSDGSWSCPHVELRRYVRLDTQDFEVRVKGDIALETVLALVEATRGTARASSSEGTAVPDIVTMIIPSVDGYYVSWNDKEHATGILVVAQLSRDGDPTVPGDWETRIYRADE